MRAETGWGLGEHGRCPLAVHEGRADCVPTDRQPGLTLDCPHWFCGGRRKAYRDYYH